MEKLFLSLFLAGNTWYLRREIIAYGEERLEDNKKIRAGVSEINARLLELNIQFSELKQRLNGRSKQQITDSSGL